MTFYYHASICSGYLYDMVRNNAFRDDFLNKKLTKISHGGD